MDLRSYSPSQNNVIIAKQLAVEGLLTYQPFVFHDDFEVGVGYEFSQNRWAGLVYYPDIDQKLLEISPQLSRLVVNSEAKEAFRRANNALRLLYDYVAAVLADSVGGARGASFLDVGCNAGYFPLTFSRMGAAQALGCDRQDFSRVFGLLNDITGLNATFLHTQYDIVKGTIPDVEPVDAVISVMVMCHISNPLSYLAAMSKLSRKAILVLTIVNTDDHYSITYGEPRGDYKDDAFPYCFDNHVCPSRSLLRRSLELLGYAKVEELDLTASGAPAMSWNGRPFCAFLAVR